MSEDYTEIANKYKAAIKGGCLQDVETLIASGTPPVPAYPGAVLHAVMQGRLEMLEPFVRAGCDIEWEDARRNTALGYAVNYNNIDIVRELLNLGACVNKISQSVYPIVAAVTRGDTSIVKLLLDHSADPNKVNPTGLTALWEGARYGSLEIIELLLASGADIQHKGPGGMTALEIARQEDEEGAVELLEGWRSK